MLCRFATLAALFGAVLLPLTATRSLPLDSHRAVYVRDTTAAPVTKTKPSITRTGLAGISSATTDIQGAVYFFQTDHTSPAMMGYALYNLQPHQTYSYHVHVSPVGANHNCTATGGHYDPYSVNKDASTYKCDGTQSKTTCELGDLSGRFGSIKANGDGVAMSPQLFIDSYLSVSNMNPVHGRSIVLHNGKGDRVACGNIEDIAN
ncbi:hypothetical protein IWQ60_000315 [Tieghemiomyces parasiticus]|uniref:Superoxide dismutase copper/zinc binding domain-containing protein n=1 Tax=Tieghemiomyces parasiticus TaxID=78921 RepID=A0A9W8E2W9_9FUNG|nr:hypothetical protein IWQ60_000315 [Tieghemiomyces parasiticus]